jgi:hypothetical protein
VKSNGAVASIWLKIVLDDEALDFVTLRPASEYKVALPFPPTSAIGTVSVMTSPLCEIRVASLNRVCREIREQETFVTVQSLSISLKETARPEQKGLQLVAHPESRKTSSAPLCLCSVYGIGPGSDFWQNRHKLFQTEARLLRSVVVSLTATPRRRLPLLAARSKPLERV